VTADQARTADRQLFQGSWLRVGTIRHEQYNIKAGSFNVQSTPVNVASSINQQLVLSPPDRHDVQYESVGPISRRSHFHLDVELHYEVE